MTKMTNVKQVFCTRPRFMKSFQAQVFKGFEGGPLGDREPDKPPMALSESRPFTASV